MMKQPKLASFYGPNAEVYSAQDYEALAAEIAALLREARASIPCNAKFTLRRIDAFLAIADSASGVQK